MNPDLETLRAVYDATRPLAQRIERLEEWVRLLHQPQATLALEVLELRDKIERYKKSRNTPRARVRAEEKLLEKQREVREKLAGGPDRSR